MTKEERKEKREQKKREAEKKRAARPLGVRILLDYIIPLAIAVVLAFLFVRFVAVRSVVEGHSMETTLSDGNNLIVEKVSYYFRDPERFEVVVFRLKEDPDTNYIKRVIGLPGELVEIREGLVYINGVQLEDDHYCPELIKDSKGKPMNREAVLVQEGTFYVLGDNRNNSRDSRAIGTVTKSQIIGRAIFRFWPLNQMKGVGK